MKYIPLLMILMLLSADLFSQENKAADSLFFYGQTQRQLELTKSNATVLLKDTLQKIGQVSLSYHYLYGGLKNSQMPKGQKDIVFSSDGITKLGKLKLYGSFTYSRMKQNELGNLLRGEDIDDEPFYYYAEKEADFQRQKFYAKGIVSYELLKNRMYLSSGFNYIYYLADRAVDPRLSLNWFDFKAAPELTWITKKFNIGVSGMLGYGIENTTIKYKNDNYSKGSSYPDRISYMNYGYGYTRRMSDNFSRRKEYKGLGIHFSGELDQWKTLFNIDYTSSTDKNRKSLNASTKSLVYSSYESDKIEGQLLMTRKKGKHLQQIELAYSNLAGDDFLNEFNASNYTAKNQNAYLAFSDLIQGGRNSIEWGLQANYVSSYKKDALTAHLFEYSYFQPGIKGGYYKIIPGKYRFSAILSPSLILPVKTDLDIPKTQEVSFTTAIVYPDYAYRKITSGSLDLKLQFIDQRISKDFRTGITFQTGLIKALQKPEIELPATTLPGNYRLSMNLALNLYF